jgi:hypothetical protein
MRDRCVKGCVIVVIDHAPHLVVGFGPVPPPILGPLLLARRTTVSGSQPTPFTSHRTTSTNVVRICLTRPAKYAGSVTVPSQ